MLASWTRLVKKRSSRLFYIFLIFLAILSLSYTRLTLLQLQDDWLSFNVYSNSALAKQYLLLATLPHAVDRQRLVNNDGQECLVHDPLEIYNTSKLAITPDSSLRHVTSAICGYLKRPWDRLGPMHSSLARDMYHHQSNCSNKQYQTLYLDNVYGMGAHFNLWSQALCNAWESNARLWTIVTKDVNHNVNILSRDTFRDQNNVQPWIWMDQAYCSVDTRNPWSCYFGNDVEGQCDDESGTSNILVQNVTDPRKEKHRCSWIKDNPSFLPTFRAASMEYMFHNLSPFVLAEARRQVGIVFGQAHIPSPLVTVHIRWGDKFWEMDLPSIDEYIQAVYSLLESSNNRQMSSLGEPNNGGIVSIYLATEDPKAAQEFIAAAPANWKVYLDCTLTELDTYRPKKGNRASWTARNTRGRAGLLALGSLLVALEADYFVLTTKSNWSRLINELRTNVIDPRCDNCTSMVDLRPGRW